jgi:predicted transcriptional regulator of viral defense system
MGRQRNRPDWRGLYEDAASQDGYFTRQQADAAGYSKPALAYHAKSGRVVRVRRGIYRVVNYPTNEHEELVVFWLWAEQSGVYAGETALNLLELSDALPAKLCLAVPEGWRRRRLRVPQGLVLHFADVTESERTWVGCVPVTNPKRTIEDCIDRHIQPDLVAQAIAQARGRGLIAQTVAASLAKRAEAQVVPKCSAVPGEVREKLPGVYA